MPRTLDSVFGAAAGLKGVFEGQDIEEARRRDREIYKSGKGGRERANERAQLEHGKFKREFAEEEGAREAAVEATDVVPRTLGGAAATETPAAAAASGAGAAASAGAEPEEPPALWLRQAKAQADYWKNKGRADRAQKVMTDAINAQIAQQEARFKFEILPRQEEARRKGLTAEEMQADQNLAGLRQRQIDLDTTNAGLMWGHVLAGNKKAALDAFNASGLTAAGVRVADIGKSADGRMIYLLDEQGQVAKDKSGKPLAYPKQLLDNLWRKATTSTITIKKGETIAQTRTGPAGGLEITPLFTSKDPAEDRAAAAASSSEDARWATVINQARDDSHKYIKDALGLTANALGQVMKPENMPIFEKAQPIVERELQKFRASGKRMDQVTVTDLAKKALKQARDEYERDQHGAGDLGNENPNAPAGPTWRDVLK